jgi:exonuclease SbcC
MRPKRLEVEGFTAFRAKTVLDFEGADLFAFVGPTGSGKSSLVDALLFALYGVVPRLGKATVEPVVSLGRNEARVRFDFSVGETDYTAARVVRRTKTGATTAEARLEGGAEPIMGADEVTAAVENLLGLGFDHFTKCVVLPQGQFAAFLQDPAAKRQELLRQLLDLGRYRRVRDLAVDRHRIAGNTVEVLARQIDDLAFATGEALQVAEQRRSDLTSIREDIDANEPELVAERESMKAAADGAELARREAALATTVEMPAGLADLTALAEESAKRLVEAEAGLAESEERRKKLDEESGETPDLAGLTRSVDLHKRLASETEALAAATEQAENSAIALEAARSAAAKADEVLGEAVGRLDGARRLHTAHNLAEHLVVGQPCPVCLRSVDALPADTEVPDDLAEAEALVAGCKQEAAEAASAASAAGELLAAAESVLAQANQRVAELAGTLADHPDAAESDRLLEARAALDARIRAAQEAEIAARDATGIARKKMQEVDQKISAARKSFDAVRDQVAALSPPAAGRERLADDWVALTEWAEATVVARHEKADGLEGSAGKHKANIEAMERVLVERLEALDIPVGVLKPRDVCVDALAAVTREVEKITDAQSKTAQLATERDHHEEAGAVAKMLANHLSAKGFEGWLMAEALEALVEGANDRLDDLSSGAFSLELAKRDFRVIDHRNADERRSVKTLSGGETFLVSLALALALAEQLASMSVHGVARLESMFLDEGFGTLDAETLDTVATVIHELGSDGRAIGLITHVKDLAEQVPVRFEVRPGAGGATVERVGA